MHLGLERGDQLPCPSARQLLPSCRSVLPALAASLQHVTNDITGEFVEGLFIGDFGWAVTLKFIYVCGVWNPVFRYGGQHA